MVTATKIRSIRLSKEMQVSRMIYFTRQEQRIIIILVVVMLRGTGALLIKRFQPGLIMRLSMGEPDFDVEKDEKSPRLKNAPQSIDQPKQQSDQKIEKTDVSTPADKSEKPPEQTPKNDTSVSIDQSEPKQVPDQDRKQDIVAETPGQKPNININTATKEELERLPRIGPVMAQRIIDYRREHSDFRNVDELMNVNGIGTKTLQGLRDLITVEDRDGSK